MTPFTWTLEAADGNARAGTFATPLLTNSGRPDIVEALANSVPHPKRLGDPDEFASLAEHIISNGMLNGETIRIDGAIRMAPR